MVAKQSPRGDTHSNQMAVEAWISSVMFSISDFHGAIVYKATQANNKTDCKMFVSNVMALMEDGSKVTEIMAGATLKGKAMPFFLTFLS